MAGVTRLSGDDELPGEGNESDEVLIERYGSPVFYAKASMQRPGTTNCSSGSKMVVIRLSA